MKESPAYSFIEERIELEFERLEREKITPWAFFCTDKGVRLTDFFGKEVNYIGGGLEFEGSPREYFWNGFIQPFLNNIVSRNFSATEDFCRKKCLEWRVPLEETAFLLKAGINSIYNKMSDIDQRLRGKGYPDSVLRYSPEREIASSEAVVDQRLIAEAALQPVVNKQIVEKYEGQRIKADNNNQLEQFFVFEGKLHYLDLGAAQVCERCSIALQHLNADEEIILTQAPRGSSYNALEMGKILDKLGITVHDGTEDSLIEIQRFKDTVERQTYKDIYVNGNPQENIARALLQVFLKNRSYREVPVREGRSDLLVFIRDGRFLYETKIWRGEEYYQKGLREIEEYIQGENDDNQLKRVFFIIFDPTKTKRAGSQRVVTVGAYGVDVIVIHISPAIPSKKTK